MPVLRKRKIADEAFVVVALSIRTALPTMVLPVPALNVTSLAALSPMLIKLTSKLVLTATLGKAASINAPVGNV